MCVCVCVDNVTISFARHAPNMTCVNRHSQILYKRKLIIQRVCGVCVNCSHAMGGFETAKPSKSLRISSQVTTLLEIVTTIWLHCVHFINVQVLK